MPSVTNVELNQKLDYTIEKIDDLKKVVDEKLVTKDYLELRLQPLDLSRKIVFGAVGLALTAMFLALIGLVVRK